MPESIRGEAAPALLNSDFPKGPKRSIQASGVDSSQCNVPDLTRPPFAAAAVSPL